jgi:hypothetical protein
MGRGSEQVDSLVLSSIFHVRTQAEADAINPLTYNPANFPSRMVVTSNTQFNFRDTTIAGQVRSVAVALTYQVSLNFTWGGSWTSREGSTGDTSNERRVNYASSGTVWFSGGHTYVGVVNMTPSGELLEVGFAVGSGLSGVYMTSANVTTLSHSSGSLAADGSGFRYSFDFDNDASCACVERVFDELFDDARGSFDHFARCDLIHKFRSEHANWHQRASFQR